MAYSTSGSGEEGKGVPYPVKTREGGSTQTHEEKNGGRGVISYSPKKGQFL